MVEYNMFPLLFRILTISVFLGESKSLFGCSELLQGEMLGFRIGAAVAESKIRSMKRLTPTERVGLEQFRVILRGGELHIYVGQKRIVRAMTLIANSNRGVDLCSHLKIGTASFETIERRLGSKPEFNDPTWSEYEMVHYEEVYRNGLMAIRFVKWTDCGLKGGNCERQAAARSNRPLAVYIE